MRSPDRDTRHARLLLFGCVLAATLLRLCYVLWADEGRYRHEAVYASDAQHYRALAESVAEGRGYRIDGRLTSWRPPLYPFMVAGIMKVVPNPLFATRLLQCLLGGLTCLPIFYLGRRLGGSSTGLLAAGGCAISYELFNLNAYLMTETVFTFLLLSVVSALIAFQQRPGVGIALLAGVVLGLSVLARPLFLLFPVALVPWMLWTTSDRLPIGRSVVLVCLLLVAAALVVSPWTIRNARVHASFVAVTTDTGKMIYGSNSPSATGGSGGWYSRGVDYRVPPELEGGGEAESSRRLVKAGMAYMVTHPGRTAALVPRKLWNMWRPWVAGASWLSALLAGSFYVVVVALAVTAMVLNRRRWMEWSLIYLVLLYVISLHALLMSTVRYRYPVMPLLMLLAASALDQVLQHRARRSTCSPAG
ncbi:MAG: glycosyltransferase family 39 protein [Verrucomicrobia bacterium]|nr:glycosyltransferase family 39 protein [Verrucomicrobiota bacterium]